jgi:hypothetical protein
MSLLYSFAIRLQRLFIEINRRSANTYIYRLNRCSWQAERGSDYRRLRFALLSNDALYLRQLVLRDAGADVQAGAHARIFCLGSSFAFFHPANVARIK